MEIIKDGNKPKATCSECKCEFTYTKDDIITSYPAFAREKYIKCPCCKCKITLEKEYW